MSLYLLDTDAVIDFLEGIEPTQELIRTLYSQRDVLCVNDVVIAEVFSGAVLDDLSDVAAFLASFRYLEGSIATARQAGEWRYAYARRGIQLAMTDALNAATAQAYGAIVLTGNVSDYPMSEISVLPLPR